MAKKGKGKFKLYVWEECLCGLYTCGIMFAVAKNVDQARDIILKKDDCTRNALLNAPDVYELDEAIGFAVCGGA